MKFNSILRFTSCGLAAVLATTATAQPVSARVHTTSTDRTITGGVRNSTGEKPNIVYILLDDLGYSDFGAYGSSIATPNIDALIGDGLLYTDYYTQPMSSPTRGTLLTGTESNLLGMGIIPEVDFGEDVPNVNGTVKPEYGTIAETLVENGYNTISVGKWHVGQMTEFLPGGDLEQWPSGKGFEYNYNFVGSQTNQFQPGGIILGNEFVIADFTEPDYHFTTDMVDRSLEFIDDAGKEDPFFLYFATGAMHGPFQAPAEFIDKYEGKFAHGWDVEVQERFQNQLEKGFFDADTVLPEKLPGVPNWDEMSDDEIKVAERHMEVYAGFLEHTDMEIGRFIDELKDRDLYDNTIFVITSDNGPNSNGMVNGSIDAHRNENLIASSIQEQLGLLDDFGTVDYGTQYSKGWTWASATPFRYHKTTTFNGGLRVPLGVTWVDGIVEPGRIVKDTVDSTDITPTMLDVVNVEQVMEIDGVEQVPMQGNSFSDSLFSTKPMVGRDTEMVFMLQGNFAYTDGEYIICTDQTGKKYLFDFVNDPTQANNLIEEMPKKADELFAKFEEKKRENNSENLVMDVLHGVSNEEIISRYGEVGEEVLAFLSTGVEPTNEEAQRLALILSLYTMKVGSSGYVGVPTSWYIDPSSPHYEREYTYYKRDGYFSSESVAPTKATSHVIKTTVTAPEGAKGVIFANGGIDGGYSVYVKNSKLYYEYNNCGERQIIESNVNIPVGTFDIEFTFDKTGFNIGDGTLKIDGEVVGTGVVSNLPVFQSFDYFSIGADVGSKVSKAYTTDFAFTGQVDKVDYLLATDSYVNNN